MCKEETTHEVLSGTMSGRTSSVLDSTVKCRKCGHTHHVTIRAERPVTVPVVVSWMSKSRRSSLALGPDEVVSVDDEVMCGEMPVLITSLESRAGARVQTAKAGDIGTIWAKRFDKVKVSFSINHHGKTYPEHMIVSPDEELLIGDILVVGKRDVVIHAIKTERGTAREGAVRARDIVRIYANIVRKTSY
ncbi:MAG: hypothetical protein JSV90_00620 [Methanobacteriota archaeon]|nr:MAG: hypothetical protein JSV90_00620 [Euryarchaeota archaeon]